MLRTEGASVGASEASHSLRPGGADDEHRIPVKAAKTLELTIPPSVLLRADRVIG